MTLPVPLDPADRFVTGWSLSRVVVARLVRWRRAFLANRPPNTARALEADARHYIRWCASRRLLAVPAAPETVTAYLHDVAGSGGRGGGPASAATIARRQSTIATLHRACDLPDPTKDALAREEVRGLVRRRGLRGTQAAPLRRTDVDAILQALEEDGTAESLQAAALICVGYDTLRRRADLARIELKHLARERDGTGRLFVPRGKTDQMGEGRWCWLAPDTVDRLTAWLELRETLLANRIGAVLRAAGERRKLRAPWQALERRLARLRLAEPYAWVQFGSDRAAGLDHGPLGPLLVAGPDPGKRVAAVIQAAARAAGISGFSVMGEGGVSGHSLRVGACQDLLANGASVLGAQQAGDWKSPVMPAYYGERIIAAESPMAQLAAKQGRVKDQQ